jgi:type I restriction enzyme S subunit
MSRLEKILQELCPNGVPTRKLEETTILRAGDRVTKANMISGGRYPVYGGGTTPTGFLNEANSSESVTIARAGSAGHVNFVKNEFWATDVCFVASQLPEGPNIKFVYHVLKARQPDLVKRIYGGSMPKLEKKFLYELPIPIPPAAIQAEIVRILDLFEDLEAELEAELEARTKQFYFYRDSLLSFSDSKTEWIRLGDVASVKMCKRVFASETLSQGEVPFYKIGTFGRVADTFVSREMFEDYKERFSYPQIGAVLLSASGTIGRTVVFDGKDAYFQDSNIIWLEHDGTVISNAFLKHWYGMVDWVTEGGTIQRLYNKHLLSVRFPKIPISRQLQIASALDLISDYSFDGSVSIQSELHKRRLQFQHYREKLLTFKEIAA